MQVRATQVMHVTHASSKCMHQTNKNAVEVAQQCDDVYQLKSLFFCTTTATSGNLLQCNARKNDATKKDATQRSAMSSLQSVPTSIFLESRIIVETFAAVEEFGSSKSFQMTFRSLAQHIPSNGLGWGVSNCLQVP